VISLILNDVKYISEIESTYNLNQFDVIKIIYRNYEYVFNTCFISKIQKIMKYKNYGKCKKRKNNSRNVM
jgi:hypothetical protein